MTPTTKGDQTRKVYSPVGRVWVGSETKGNMSNEKEGPDVYPPSTLGRRSPETPTVSLSAVYPYRGGSPGP